MLANITLCPFASTCALGSTITEIHVVDDGDDTKVQCPAQGSAKDTLPILNLNGIDASGEPSATKLSHLGALPVVFKNGKVSFSEKKLSLDRHPAVVAAIFQFHQLIAQLKQNGQDELPLARIPNEHWCLVAMLVQERDASMTTLVKSIETQLCPVVFGEKKSGNSDILAPGAVEDAVLNIADLHNYGVTLASLRESCGVELDDVPHNLSIQRWEVRDLALLPEDVREVVLKRRQQRQDAHIECARWFQALESETQGQILAGSLKKLKINLARTPAKQKRAEHATAKDIEVNDGVISKKASQVPRGQKSLQTFFVSEKGLEKGDRAQAAPACCSEDKSFYRATFLPFHLRKNTTMYRYEPPKSFDPSELDRVLSRDGQYQQVQDVASSRDAATLYLRQFVSAPRQPMSLRSGMIPDCSIVDGSCSSELDAAELYLLQLRMRPMKLFHFHGSQRPDYWGTWSRKLRGVSARRPFGRDTASLDYDVDSDVEWEAEEEGEDIRSDDDEEDDEEDSDDDVDDEDFDEQHSFIVGDRMLHMGLGEQVLSDDGESGAESDTDEESNFNSEDEVMEEIDPSEEVCNNDMDVDDAAELGSGRRRKACVIDSASSMDPTHHSTLLANDRPKAQFQDEKSRDRLPLRRAKVLPLTPMVIGLIWDRDSSALAVSALDALTVCTIERALPLRVSVAAQDIQPTRPAVRTNLGKCEGTAGTLARKPRDVTDADLNTLIDVVHGSSFGIGRLVELLRPQLAGASKALIERLIHEHAVKEKRPPATRSMWYVNERLVEQLRTSQHTSGIFTDPSLRSGSPVACTIAFAGVSGMAKTEESSVKRQRVGEAIDAS
ncbi:hypothetical protein IWW37_005350 [Coemansia sp. RSA 2050]|nr:hypothetical protein IWW37_005350 [Coemansia sp. RSA 2050]